MVSPDSEATPMEKRGLMVIAKRIRCDPTCPYYVKCPMILAAQKEGGVCIIKDFPVSFQRSFLNLFTGGAEGFRQEIQEQLLTIRTITPVDSSATAAKDYLNLLLKSFGLLYGKEKNTDIPERLVIQMNEPKEEKVVKAEYRFTDARKRKKDGK